jgi:hypothetical protein
MYSNLSSLVVTLFISSNIFDKILLRVKSSFDLSNLLKDLLNKLLLN